ncbi:conserved hypothetical protein [Cupriavidus taiwanensis]|nr:conserved hypothetical protein [Cupriavidus taiwanensis]
MEARPGAALAVARTSTRRGKSSATLGAASINGVPRLALLWISTRVGGIWLLTVMPRPSLSDPKRSFSLLPKAQFHCLIVR